MKICVTSTGESLDSAVDPRFGRCAYFVVVDPATMEFKSFANPNIQSSGGAGIQAGQFVASQGAEAVITGNVGPNASQTLASAGIKVFTGASGTVREAVQKFKEKKLQEAAGATVLEHHGKA